LNAALGWFFIPLGQATLYVFIIHIFFALLVSNIPVLSTGNVLLNSAVYVVILGLLWVMVKTKFLFKVVPR
jgi:fucose 4-O-acetylase-like acetyltransferase